MNDRLCRFVTATESPGDVGVWIAGGNGDTGLGKVDARVSITLEGDAWEFAVSWDVGSGEVRIWCCPAAAVLARAS